MTEHTREDLYLKIGELTAEVAALREEQKLMRGDINGLKAQANKWKGAFGVIILGGGFLGWAGSWMVDHLGAMK